MTKSKVFPYGVRERSTLSENKKTRYQDVKEVDKHEKIDIEKHPMPASAVTERNILTVKKGDRDKKINVLPVV